VIRTVIHYSDSTVFGGTERAILHLVKGVDRSRWRVVLLHDQAAPQELVGEAHEAGAATHAAPRVAGKLDVAHLAELAAAVRSHRAQVFHAHLHWPLACKYGIAAAAIARVPAIVATAQLHVELDRAGFVDLQHRAMTSVVDRYIAVSRAVGAQLQQRFGVPAAKVTVIPNAVDIGDLDATLPWTAPRARGAPPPGWPVTDGRRAALILARLEGDKGIEHAIQAVASLPDVALVIAGTGTYRPELEARTAALGITDRVHFLGYRRDTAALLHCADVFVLPSLVEGLPLSVLEAMAAGVPVVATDIPGTREAVEHDVTGLLVPPRDAEALATAIGRVFGDAASSAARVARARERARREFSAEVVVARVTTLYASLLGEPAT
jgi:glycosyltransferase involved in cell wall biosynthesis